MYNYHLMNSLNNKIQLSKGAINAPTAISGNKSMSWATVANTAPKSKDKLKVDDVNKVFARPTENTVTTVDVTSVDVTTVDVTTVDVTTLSTSDTQTDKIKEPELSIIVEDTTIRVVSVIEPTVEKVTSQKKKTNKTDEKNKNQHVDTMVAEQEKQRKLLEIEDTIKKVCCEKADSVKKAFLIAFKINNPKKAEILANEEYFKTFNLFYEKLSEKFKPQGSNANISQILEFQLYDDQDEKKVDENEVDNIVKKVDDIVKKVDENEVDENKDVVIEKNVDDNNKSSNETFNGWKEIKTPLKTKFSDMNLDEKHQQLIKFAREFSEKLIQNGSEIKRSVQNEKKNAIIYEITINCTGQRLGFINDKPIYPNKFLDPTYVENSVYHSAAHQCFKRQFFEVLKSRLGENHNLHVRFDKDYNNPLIFHIKFFKRRMQDNWIVHKNKPLDKNQYIKKY